MGTKRIFLTKFAVRAAFFSIVLASAGLLVFGYQTGSGVVKQIGALALMFCALCIPLFVVGPGRRKRILRSVAGVSVFVFVFYIGGEVILRFVYSQGESFSSHVGPIVKRYE